MTYLVECDQGLNDLATGLFRVFAQFEYCLDLPGFCGERLAHFLGLSLEGDGALEAER